ncbi:MAG: hypothetical protein Q4G26_02890 [Paracoccus sp. (in: a-proteobacteria)]|nr:hypothetical protein [Paracoccus sp. (in: a-proteobacteria)]
MAMAEEEELTDFDISYSSNLEPDQIVQKCDCADAFVTVEPAYTRDARPIHFAATLRRMDRHDLLDDSDGEVEYWRTRKHPINIYNLDVRPRIGTTYHDYRDIPLDEAFQRDIPFQGNQTAFIRVKISRKASIIYDIPYDFWIEDDYTAYAGASLWESGRLASRTNDFFAWPDYINASASRFAVPRILLLSIAVMETTRGWYDAAFQPARLNSTIRPMNVHISYWKRFFSRVEMYDLAKNFDAGAFLLRRIIERLAPNDRTTRKIATL